MPPKTPLAASANDKVGVVINFKDEFNYMEWGPFNDSMVVGIGWNISSEVEKILKSSLNTSNRVDFLVDSYYTFKAKESLMDFAKSKDWKYIVVITEGYYCYYSQFSSCAAKHWGLGIKDGYSNPTVVIASVNFQTFDVASNKQIFNSKVSKYMDISLYNFAKNMNTKMFESSLKCLLEESIKQGITELQGNKANIFKTYLPKNNKEVSEQCFDSENLAEIAEMKAQIRERREKRKTGLNY